MVYQKIINRKFILDSFKFEYHQIFRVQVETISLVDIEDTTKSKGTKMNITLPNSMFIHGILLFIGNNITCDVSEKGTMNKTLFSRIFDKS